MKDSHRLIGEMFELRGAPTDQLEDQLRQLIEGYKLVASGVHSRAVPHVFAGQDKSVDDIVDNLQSDGEFEVHLLDSTLDGIEQITEILADYQNVSAVHFVSHGSAGEVQLGSTTLTADNISSYASQISSMINSPSSKLKR